VAFSEFYVTGTGVGSNLNSGSTSSATPIYTSTGGAWAANVFTPSDGSTPASTVTVGDWVSIYPTCNTTTPYIAQVTVVGSGVNGTITLSSTAKFGTAPGTLSTTANAIDGGAWADLGMLASGVALNTGTVTQSTCVNIKAATYANTTTARSFTLAGSTTAPLWWRGYQTTPGDQDYVANPTLGTNVPLITFTTNVATLAGNYQFFSSLGFTSAAASRAVYITGSNITLYGCNVVNTGTNAFSYAVTITGSYVRLIFCYVQAATTATEVVSGSVASTPWEIDGCTISGGTAGIACGVNISSVSSCIFTGQAGDSATVSTGALTINGNTIYNTNGNGINLTSTGVVYAKNNYFEGIPSGKAAINNTSGTNTGNITAVANSYYNVAATILGTGDFPAIFDNGVLASSGLTNASGGNFTPTSVLYGLGFPGKFLGTTAYQGYLDGGAVQHRSGGPPGLIMMVRGTHTWID
jgi:hypothetical protein